ncbi:MAG: hypothetical protein EPO26_05000 [Chloroflexota bacterium]|nr:MAG: hypothetical protein EPO26_05000 [Chloroflexota bacterium]
MIIGGTGIVASGFADPPSCRTTGDARDATENQRTGEGSPYYRLPPGEWGDIDADGWDSLRTLAELSAAALDTGDPARPPPLDVALKAHEVSRALFASLAGDEGDLRQIITTLRTAHAVAWDMYDAGQAERATVAAFMTRLRETIEDFERDLGALQKPSTRETD